MFDTIKPQALALKSNLEVNLYVLKMPDKWLSQFNINFFDIRKKKRILKTKPMDKLLFSLHKDIVFIGDFYNYPTDNTWIISTTPIEKYDLLSAVKAWSYYAISDIKDYDIKEIFKEWDDNLNVEDIGEFEECSFQLTDEDGYISNKKIFSILSNLAN